MCTWMLDEGSLSFSFSQRTCVIIQIRAKATVSLSLRYVLIEGSIVKQPTITAVKQNVEKGMIVATAKNIDSHRPYDC